MSDKAFVDTNILLYAHDAAAGSKHQRARALVEELWRERCGVLSTQVLQELCVNLRRKVRVPLHERVVREIVADYLSWEIQVNTGDSVLAALDIEERYGISFWDALIIEAAQSAGAGIIYSEDFSEAQNYGTVAVINPLRGN